MVLDNHTIPSKSVSNTMMNTKNMLNWIYCKKCNGARLDIHKCPFNGNK